MIIILTIMSNSCEVTCWQILLTCYLYDLEILTCLLVIMTKFFMILEVHESYHLNSYMAKRKDLMNP